MNENTRQLLEELRTLRSRNNDIVNRITRRFMKTKGGVNWKAVREHLKQATIDISLATWEIEEAEPDD